MVILAVIYLGHLKNCYVMFSVNTSKISHVASHQNILPKLSLGTKSGPSHAWQNIFTNNKLSI